MEHTRRLEFPTLTNNEVAAYYAKTRDTRARDEAMLRFDRLIYSCVKAYRQRADYDDLIQEGRLAMLQILDTYDATRADFSTIAVHYICGKVRHYIRDKGNLVRIPAWVQEHYRKEFLARTALEASFGRLPTDQEVCETLSIPEQRLNSIHTNYPYHTHCADIDMFNDHPSDGSTQKQTPSSLTSDIFGDREYCGDGMFIEIEERMTIQSSSVNMLMRTFGLSIFEARKLKESVT